MRRCVLVFLITCASHSVFAQDAQETAQDAQETLQQSLQSALQDAVEQTGWPGATAAIVLPDGTLIRLAAGTEDVDSDSPMPVNGRMLVGSTGKMIVSAVALQLVDEGLLELDRPVAAYLESRKWWTELPGADQITIRQLMNHTSGLPRYIFQAPFTDSLVNDPLREWTIEQRLELVSDLDGLHPPGEGWAYSDTNYIVLGAILEKVTGEAFYDLAQRRVIEPLGLSDTLPSTQPALPGLVQGHFGDNNPFGLSGQAVAAGSYVINPQFEWCGGGFLSTSADLARLARGIHNDELIAPDAYRELIEPVDFRSGQSADSGYGLGTFVWKTGHGLFYGHAGIMPGYLTQIEYSAEHGFAVALQCNSDADMGRHHHARVQALAQVVIDHLQRGNDQE